eukprot:g2187.t1
MPAAVPQVEKREVTVAVGFNLSGIERHKKAQEELERKRQEREIAEENARIFKANPIDASTATHGLQRFAPRPLTEPQPFTLSTSRVKESPTRIATKKSFRARPIPSSHDAPFHISKSEKPLSEIVGFQFASDRRAKEREAFEKDASRRRAEAEREAARIQEENIEAENARIDSELAAMRFKARKSVEEVTAMLKRGPLQIAQSDKLLTTPSSPNLSASRTR